MDESICGGLASRLRRALRFPRWPPAVRLQRKRFRLTQIFNTFLALKKFCGVGWLKEENKFFRNLKIKSCVVRPPDFGHLMVLGVNLKTCAAPLLGKASSALRVITKFWARSKSRAQVHGDSYCTTNFGRHPAPRVRNFIFPKFPNFYFSEIKKLFLMILFFVFSLDQIPLDQIPLDQIPLDQIPLDKTWY